MKKLVVLLFLAGCGNPNGDPIQVEPIEIKVTVEGVKPITVDVVQK